MKAIDKFQVGNHIHIAKSIYKGIKEITITHIEHDQISFRFSKGKMEIEGTVHLTSLVGVKVGEKDLEMLLFEKNTVLPAEYSCKYHPDFKIQVINHIITYKAFPILYIHQLQNLFFAITGKALIIARG